MICITYVEHISHVVNRNERIIHCNNLDLRIQPRSPEHQSSNAAKAIDSYFDGPIKIE